MSSPLSTEPGSEAVTNERCARTWERWRIATRPENSPERQVFNEMAGEIERLERVVGHLRKTCADFGVFPAKIPEEQHEN